MLVLPILKRDFLQQHDKTGQHRITASGQFHEEIDKVKINKYVFYHCKLIALNKCVLRCRIKRTTVNLRDYPLSYNKS